MSDLWKLRDDPDEWADLIVEGVLVNVEPVGYLERYTPRESVDGASVESIRWFGAKKPGRYAIVRVDDADR